MPHSSFVTYLIEDAFSHIPGISARAMFGGYGVYKGDFFFALVDEDDVYFKVDETNKKDYEEIDSKPFVYSKNGKNMTIGYYLVPGDILEDKDRVEEWIQKAVEVARRSKNKP